MKNRRQEKKGQMTKKDLLKALGDLIDSELEKSNKKSIKLEYRDKWLKKSIELKKNILGMLVNDQLTSKEFSMFCSASTLLDGIYDHYRERGRLGELTSLAKELEKIQTQFQMIPDPGNKK